MPWAPPQRFFETLTGFFLYYILTIGAVEMAPTNEKIEQETVDYGDPRSSFRKAES